MARKTKPLKNKIQSKKLSGKKGKALIAKKSESSSNKSAKKANKQLSSSKKPVKATSTKSKPLPPIKAIVKKTSSRAAPKKNANKVAKTAEPRTVRSPSKKGKTSARVSKPKTQRNATVHKAKVSIPPSVSSNVTSKKSVEAPRELGAPAIIPPLMPPSPEPSRKRGRPRKLVAEVLSPASAEAVTQTIVPKRGRPRKPISEKAVTSATEANFTELTSQQPQRKRGRPPKGTADASVKTVTERLPQAPVNKRGRPPKVKTEVDLEARVGELPHPTTRKRGRPPKVRTEVGTQSTEQVKASSSDIKTADEKMIPSLKLARGDDPRGEKHFADVSDDSLIEANRPKTPANKVLAKTRIGTKIRKKLSGLRPLVGKRKSKKLLSVTTKIKSIKHSAGVTKSAHAKPVLAQPISTKTIPHPIKPHAPRAIRPPSAPLIEFGKPKSLPANKSPYDRIRMDRAERTKPHFGNVGTKPVLTAVKPQFGSSGKELDLSKARPSEKQASRPTIVSSSGSTKASPEPPKATGTFKSLKPKPPSENE